METHSENFMIQDSPAPMVILDTEMKIVNHSEEWKIAHGIKDEKVLGKSIYELEHEIPMEFRKILQKCLSGTKNSSMGQKFKLSNGEALWLSWKINPWRGAHGDVIGLIVILENVTTGKRKEELLIKAQEVARIGGWEVDLLSNEVHWTDLTREIHEMPADYIPNLEDGINFYKAGVHREKISLLVSEAISMGKPWNTESIIITGKGKEVWVRARGEAEIVNGVCVRLIGTFQDIDERKKADERYREISERLAIATNAAGVGVWEYNIKDNVLVWDDNMYKLYGIQKKDFSGVYDAWESSVHPDDKERSQKEVELAISGVKEFRTEFRTVRSNGDIHHIKAVAVIQKNVHGEPHKMIGINWDISEIRQADEKLKNLLNITKEQNQGLTNFAYIVSHNLRTHSINLSELSGYLVNSDKVQSEEEQQNIIRMIHNGATSLNETVLHLDDVVKIKSDIKEKIEKISLHKTIEGVLKNIEKLLEDEDATCNVQIDNNLKVNAVPAYLESIILNLLTNSLRYSHPKRQPRIDISASKVEDHVLLKFKDNGQGIDLKRHGQKLFGLYKTFHGHKDSKGIGLFITKNQIQAMDGKITVDSIVGEWTEFGLYFTYR